MARLTIIIDTERLPQAIVDAATDADHEKLQKRLVELDQYGEFGAAATALYELAVRQESEGFVL
jgi:hypothetical protein